MADAKKKVKTLEEFRKLDEKALVDKIADLRKELVGQQRAHKAGELPSAASIAKTRKSIAKALTVLNEKANAADEPAQKEQEK